jgi:hypothetical protein
MSETSYENVVGEDENGQVTMTEESGGEEVVVNHSSSAYQDDEDAPPMKPPKGSFRPQYEDDGSDGAWVKHVVEDLLLWHHPVHSALWLVVFFLVFFLVKVSEYSLLTLICYLVLLQLIATTAAIRSAPVLKSMNLLRASFDPKTFALQRQAFSAEELFRFSRGCAEIGSEWILEWNDTLETRNAKKVLRVASAFFWLAVFGLVIPFDVMLLLFVLGLFTVLKIYDLQHERIDEILNVLYERYDEKLAPVLRKVYPLLDSVLYRLEPIIGRFDD